MHDKYIAVLDFASGEVHIYTTQEDPTTDEAENYIEQHGHRANDCEFMIMDVLALNFH